MKKYLNTLFFVGTFSMTSMAFSAPTSQDFICWGVDEVGKSVHTILNLATGEDSKTFHTRWHYPDDAKAKDEQGEAHQLSPKMLIQFGESADHRHASTTYIGQVTPKLLSVHSKWFDKDTKKKHAVLGVCQLKP